MPHVVLLGDSILDNGRYVEPGEPAVIAQVLRALPDGWRTTLLAVDGSVIADVSGQLAQLPADATHLVISAGGNDALEQSYILTDRASSVAEVLQRLAEIQEEFERGYRRMLDVALRHRLPTALCAIYYPNHPNPDRQRLERLGLAVFDDVILRVAFEAGLPLIDLRLVCNEPSDYSNEIEPSARGGEKIARATAQVVTTHDFAGGRTVVYS